MAKPIVAAQASAAKKAALARTICIDIVSTVACAHRLPGKFVSAAIRRSALNGHRSTVFDHAGHRIDRLQP
ncbi:MAG: hypothetical protein M3Z16_07930, partial [Pseudomonadota bacterium]|nr:hypothetical protein [Pseudomonadota bacterium]